MLADTTARRRTIWSGPIAPETSAGRSSRLRPSDGNGAAWCRCLETARIAFGIDPAVDDALSNLFDNSPNRDRQVAAFRKLVASAPKQGNLFLVTHGSTTAAFTGINQGTAEMVIVTPEGGDRYRVAGRLAAQ